MCLCCRRGRGCGGMESSCSHTRGHDGGGRQMLWQTSWPPHLCVGERELHYRRESNDLFAHTQIVVSVGREHFLSPPHSQSTSMISGKGWRRWYIRGLSFSFVIISPKKVSREGVGRSFTKWQVYTQYQKSIL